VLLGDRYRERNKYKTSHQQNSLISNTDCYLTDTLGIVRLMIVGDSVNEVVLAREYSPFGEVTSHSGEAESLFGFTGELQAGGLAHLRARVYDLV
jgi:hypothetical protein